MSRPLVTHNAGLAASSKRLKKSTPITLHVPATGVFTIAAGFLNELAVGDVVRFSALTGGSAIDTAADYYLLPPRWNLGATTFSVSATPNGPMLTGGTAVTVGTLSTGDLTQAEDGVLSGNYISQNSPAGR